MLVILDRDGVINYDSENYIKSPEEWIPYPGSLAAIASLNKAGHQVVVATNQSGIGRGYYSEDTLQKIHAKMLRLLAEEGGHLDAIYYCPHVPADQCECRKPKPGMVLQAIDNFAAEISQVVLIGDALRDIQAAHAAGVRAILVRSGKGDALDAEDEFFRDVVICADLAEAVNKLLR